MTDYSTPLQPVMVESGLNNLWNNPFIYLIFFLFFGRGFMNGGFGGFDSQVNQQLSNDFLYSNLASGQRQIENQMQAMGTNLGNGICSLGYETAQQFGNLKSDLAACCCSTQRAIDQSTFALSRQLDSAERSIDACCCQTQKGIMESTYALTNNLNSGFNGVHAQLCDMNYNITNAIHADGEATRALINANTVQDLRDRLQAAELTLANAAQTQNLTEQLNAIYNKVPIPPVPSYPAPFPPYPC